MPGVGTQEELYNGGPAGWYRMSDHNTSGEGLIKKLSSSPATGITELPIYGILFDANGSTGSIKLTYPFGNARPQLFTITIDPDEWLKYNPADPTTGDPTFSIKYLLQGLKWKGEGKTGHVIGTQPYSGENKRLNW